MNRLSLKTQENTFEYQFTRGVNVIAGPVGSGKSSMLELIRYALGGNATLSRAVIESVRAAELEIDIGDQRLQLFRRIGTNQISVEQEGHDRVTLTTGRAQNLQRASNFLLDAIGIPAVQVTRSRARPTGATHAISFMDIFKYCYVPQSEIDRSVIQHLDSVLEPRRKAVFELVFGLVDPLTSQLEVERAKLTDELQRARVEVAVVDKFLGAGDEVNAEALIQEEYALLATLEETRSELEALRAAVRSATPVEEELRTRTAEMAVRVEALTRQLRDQQATASQRYRLQAQIELELQKLSRGEAAAQILADIDFAVCPRCAQRLDHRIVADGHCYVCTQPDPTPQEDTNSGHAPSVALDTAERAAGAERRRLEGVLTEIASLLATDQNGIVEIEDGLQSARETLGVLEREVEERTRAYVSPLFERTVSAGAAIASAEEQLRAVGQRLLTVQKRDALAERVTELQARVQSLDRQLTEAHVGADAKRAQLGELSEVFNDMIQRLQVPWYESAYIDPNTYLPVVNESPFEAQSAGVKTVINVAYHLSMLTHALREGTTLLPALQILDGPQKNLGGTPEDRALGDRLYQRLSTVRDAYGRDFQVILADNTLTQAARQIASVIELSYETPLIPDLQHPGPDVDTIYPE